MQKRTLLIHRLCTLSTSYRYTNLCVNVLCFHHSNEMRQYLNVILLWILEKITKFGESVDIWFKFLSQIRVTMKLCNRWKRARSAFKITQCEVTTREFKWRCPLSTSFRQSVDPFVVMSAFFFPQSSLFSKKWPICHDFESYGRCAQCSTF